MYPLFVLLLLAPTVATAIQCYQGVVYSQDEQPSPAMPTGKCSKYCMYQRCPVGTDCSTYTGTYSCGDASCTKSTTNKWSSGRYCCQTSLCTPPLTNDDVQPYYDIIGPPGNIGNPGPQPYYDIIGHPGGNGNPGTFADPNDPYNPYSDSNGPYVTPTNTNSVRQYLYWISNVLPLVVTVFVF